MFWRTIVVLGVLLGTLEGYQLATESTSFTSSIAHLLFTNNLHEILPGRLFRSAEMTVQEFVPEVKERKIRTVLDVRMDPVDVDKPYQGEKEALEADGIRYVSFPLLGSKEMTQDQVRSLLKLLDEVEPPLLVHCSSGTHRSGVVSAIYLMEREGRSYEEAVQQLSSKYGFFKVERQLKSVISGRPTIDNILWRYGEYRRKEPTLSFRNWVEAGMPSSHEAAK